MDRLPVVVLLAAACTNTTPLPPEKKPTEPPMATPNPPAAPEPPAIVKSGATDQEIGAISRSINELAIDLYGRLRSREGNLFMSPYSISTALAMTYGGARGDTATEMKKTLRFSLDPKRLHAAEAGLVRALHSEGVTLHVANALWAAAGHPFLPDFLDMARRHYGARVEEVDFRNEEAARKTINDWVEQQTREKIKDLIPKDLLDALTRLVLANAIYFKGAWAEKFDEGTTGNEPFYLLDGDQVRTMTMEQTDNFRTATIGNVQVLELPYAGRELSMLIALPQKRDGLPALEQKLSAKSVRTWREALRKTRIRVLLPRFKIESSFSLGNVLQALGMRDAFSRDTADFSGMNGNPDDLYIAAVLHKAFVEVNEEGTEAAGATAVVMKSRGRPAPPPEFRADHPFVFLIQHEKTGAILFLGRLTNPKG